LHFWKQTIRWYSAHKIVENHTAMAPRLPDNEQSLEIAKRLDAGGRHSLSVLRYIDNRTMSKARECELEATDFRRLRDDHLLVTTTF
jgi:hypothetical protein